MIAKTRDIRIQWRELAAQPLRQRAIADQIGISEAELVASGVGISDPDNEIVRLDLREHHITQLLADLPQLGSVMALTRNENCVHEKNGPYENIQSSPFVTTVVGKDIDLRIFQKRWIHGFAMTEHTERGPRHSLQFYLRDGSSAHKIFLNKKSNENAFFELRKRYAAAKQIAGIEKIDPIPVTEYPLSSEIDISQLQEDWKAMTDIHHFFQLLKKHGVTRTQAMRLAPEGYTNKVYNQALQKMLEGAAEKNISVMIFVGNYGCLQIHTGTIRNIKWMNHWFNVLDPGFQLHLQSNQIAETWVMQRPVSNGTFSHLELFDAQGKVIAYLYEEPTSENSPNSTDWNTLIAGLI